MNKLFWALAAVFAVIFWGAMQGEKHNKKENERITRVVAELERQDAQEDARHFNANANKILLEVMGLIEEGKLNEAIELSSRYLVSGNEPLKKANLAAQTKRLSNLLKDVPEADSALRAEIFGQLETLHPEHGEIKKRAAYYRSLVAQAQQKIEADAQARVDQYGEPPTLVFGRYLTVEKYLKSAAHDPSSISIQGCSDVLFKQSGWLVGCEYLGKNPYGATVRSANWFTIVHGQVVKVESSTAH